MHTINHKQTNHAISQLPPPSAYRLIYLLLFILFTSSVQAQGLFDSLELQQVLYKDAAHAYDDDQVILLSRQRVPQLSSRLVPVQTGDEITLSTFVHYSSAPAHKTWQKIGAAAAVLAIGSLPHLLDRNKANQEGSGGNDLLKKAAPLAGAGVAALPFVLDKRKGKAIGKNLNIPKSKNDHRGNGLFVPDAYLSYTFYDLEGKVLTSDVQSIDRHAKDAWQQLALQTIAPQDGYVQVEVGNGSKRPVWVEKINVEKKRVNKRREKNDDTSLSKNIIEDNYPVTTQSANCCEWVCVYTLYSHYCTLECPTDWYCDDWTPPDPPNEQYPGPGGGGSPPSSGSDPVPVDGNGDGQAYERSETKRKLQSAYLPVEGVGIAGAYEIKSSIWVVETANGTYLINVSAIGKTSAPIGTVDFEGDVKITFNGSVMDTQRLRQTGSSYYESGYQVIGNATFEMPYHIASTGKIVVEAGYRHLNTGAFPAPSRTTIQFNIHE